MMQKNTNNHNKVELDTRSNLIFTLLLNFNPLNSSRYKLQDGKPGSLEIVGVS